MCQVGDRWKGAGRHIHLTYHLIRTHFIILLWMGGSCQVPHVQDEYQHWGTHWGRCHALEGIRLLIEKESITRDICSGLWVDLWTVDKFTGNRTWLWLCRSWTFCSEELKGNQDQHCWEDRGSLGVLARQWEPAATARVNKRGGVCFVLHCACVLSRNWSWGLK